MVGSTPTHPLCETGFANWQSGQVESLMVVGSTPTSVTQGKAEG
jgi:hypothetical protein